MSADLLKRAFAVRAPSPTDKLVLLALAHRAQADGCAPTAQRELREATGLSERAVRDALATLDRAGLIARGRDRCRLKLEGAKEDDDRHDAPVAAPDRRYAPVDDLPALRARVVAEVGEWRAASLFDGGRLEDKLFHARSPVAARQLRALRAFDGVEIRTG